MQENNYKKKGENDTHMQTSEAKSHVQFLCLNCIDLL